MYGVKLLDAIQCWSGYQENPKYPAVSHVFDHMTLIFLHNQFTTVSCPYCMVSFDRTACTGATGKWERMALMEYENVTYKCLIVTDIWVSITD